MKVLYFSTANFSPSTYLSKKSLSTTAQMSSKGFPIPKSELGLKHKDYMFKEKHSTRGLGFNTRHELAITLFYLHVTLVFFTLM